jgi:hypothetical protein
VLGGMRERFEQHVSANSGGFEDDDEWSIIHSR